MNVKYQGYDVAKIDVARGFSIRGERGLGRYRVCFDMELAINATASNLGNLRFFLTSGRLLSRGRSTPLYAEGPHHLRSVSSLGLRPLRMYAEADDRQVTLLDETRNGGDLVLDLFLVFQIVGAAAEEEFEVRLKLAIKKEEWLEALTSAAYGAVVTSEIVVPRGVADPELASAVDALDKAISRLASGEADDCVGTCRIALEASKAARQLPTNIRLDLAGRQKEDLLNSERIAILRYALHLATHPPHHQPRAGFSRDEAKMIVSCTAAIVALEAKTRPTP